MSYVDQSNRPSAAGLASSIIVQAAIGATIIAGLSVTQFAPPDEGKEMDPIEYKLPPPPDPEIPPEVKSEPQPDVATQPPIHVPDTSIIFDDVPTTIETSPIPYDGPIILKPLPEADKPPVAPPPAFDAVAARPRNDPGAWLRDSDYRSSWIRREYTGTAKFRLDIAASGAVTGCRLIGSTGHEELDQATCKLVQRRAKFEPARGTNGEPVSGSYTSSVRWVLPE